MIIYKLIHNYMPKGTKKKETVVEANGGKMKHISAASIVLTENCNLACSFCYEKSKSPKTMTVLMVRGAVDFIFANRKHGQELSLLWFGGEPLLNFAIFKHGVRYSDLRAAMDNVKVVHHVSTNATIWNDEIEQFFINNPNIHLQLSWQGIAEMQNEDRGAAELVEYNVARISSNLSNRMDVQIQIMPKFVHLLAAAVDHIVSITKGKAAIVLRAVPEADGWNDPAVIAEMERQVYACVKKHGRLVKRLNDCESGEIIYKTDCMAGREFCAFVPSGDIYFCHRVYFGQRDKGEQFKIGDIEQGFYETDLTKEVAVYRRDFVVGCIRCKAKNLCYCCYACNYESTGILLRPDPLHCAVNSAFAAGIERYLSERVDVK